MVLTKEEGKILFPIYLVYNVAATFLFSFFSPLISHLILVFSVGHVIGQTEINWS